MCGLGRGIASTGQTESGGRERSRSPICAALSRSPVRSGSIISRCWRRRRCATPATAMLLLRRSKRQCGVPVEIIDGAEEARLSAAGVLAGMPDADGIVADLGGGSVELVRVGAGGRTCRVADEIGQGISLPLGPLRLAELGESTRAISETIERALVGTASVLRGAGQEPLSGRRRGARHRAAAHGAHALSAAHHPPIHDCTAGGRSLFRHHRPPVAQIARKDHHDHSQASRSGAVRGADPAQADRGRTPADGSSSRRSDCARAMLRACPRSGTSVSPVDRRLCGDRRARAGSTSTATDCSRWTAPLFPNLSEASAGDCIAPLAGSVTSRGASIPTIAPSRPLPGA